MMRDSSNYLEKEYISIKEWCQMKFPLIFILDFTNHIALCDIRKLRH